MTALLTRDQADLLAAYGWQSADLLLDADEAIPHAKGSMSCAVGEPWSWRTESRGIVGRRGRHAMVVDDGGDAVLVSWSLIRSAAKAVPDKLGADLRQARRRTRREWARHFPEFAPWAPGGRAAWVAPPPAQHREAQDAQQRALAACLSALSGAPVIRTRIGPHPPHKPASVDTWLWSRCLTCDWYAAHLEERQAMEHTIETQEHRCGPLLAAEQLDLFAGLS